MTATVEIPRSKKWGHKKEGGIQSKPEEGRQRGGVEGHVWGMNFPGGGMVSQAWNASGRQCHMHTCTPGGRIWEQS
jgi:hypothetical protein